MRPRVARWDEQVTEPLSADRVAELARLIDERCHAPRSRCAIPVHPRTWHRITRSAVGLPPSFIGGPLARVLYAAAARSHESEE